MNRFFLALLLVFSLAWVPFAFADGFDLYQALVSRGDWVTVSQAGEVNHLRFRGFDSEGLSGVMVRTWIEWDPGGDRIERTALHHFHIESGALVVLQGGHYFIRSADDGFLWRVEPDAQTVEPD